MNLTTIINKHFKLIGIIISFIYLLGLCLTIGLNHKAWTDEGHFQQTIIYFTETPILTSLLHYEEMSTPLPFILYAIWGKIFSVELYSLRILSLIIAFIFFNICLSFFYRVSNNKTISIFLLLVLMLNPYFIGISFFVYTDMLATLTLLIGFYTFIDKKYLLSAIFLGLSILCRQYLVYGLIAWAFTIIYKELYEQKKLPKELIYLLIPLIINVSLFIYWKGSTPQNLLKNVYIDNAFKFHFNAFTAYIASFGIYASPIFLFISKKIKPTIYFIGIILGLSLYFTFPIEVSEVALNSIYKFNTIGFFHKLILQTSPIIQNSLWILSTAIGLILTIHLFNNTLNNKTYEIIFISSVWVAFLMIMPLSYLTWEKYIIPILPFLIVFPFQQKMSTHNLE